MSARRALRSRVGRIDPVLAALRVIVASGPSRASEAPHRAHGLRTWFTPDGIRAHGRSAAGSPLLAKVTLQRGGRGEQFVVAPPGVVASDGARTEIRRTSRAGSSARSPLPQRVADGVVASS